jgi:uncharacterized protein
MKRFTKIAIPTLFLLSCAGYLFLEHGVPYAIIRPMRTTHGPKPTDLGLDHTHFKLQVADTIALDTYFIPAKTADSNSTTLILLHGIGGNKESWVQTAAMFNQWGYNTLLYDARAHGASDGLNCTLGFYEKTDVSKAIDWLEANHPGGRVGVVGNSMGGAVALQALAIDRRIAFGIIECAFTDLHTVVNAYQKRYAQGFALPSITTESIEKAGVIAQFDPKQVCPICDASKITQPILLIHGSADVNIAPSSMDQIYEALGSSKKEKILVQGADHYTIMKVGGDSLRNSMHQFLEEQRGNAIH